MEASNTDSDADPTLGHPECERSVRFMVRANAVLPRARSGTAAKGEKGSVVSPKTQWLPALRFSHFRVQPETNTRVRPTAGLMLMAAKAARTCTKTPFFFFI